MDSNLSKQRTAIGSLKTVFCFSDSTTRQIKVKIAVCDTSDKFIIDQPFFHKNTFYVFGALEMDYLNSGGPVRIISHYYTNSGKTDRVCGQIFPITIFMYLYFRNLLLKPLLIFQVHCNIDQHE
jgi:hypothetical protein